MAGHAQQGYVAAPILMSVAIDVMTLRSRLSQAALARDAI